MPEPLQIDAQGTPNPNAAKFTLNRVVATQGRTYRLPAAPGGAQAGLPADADDEWARALLGIPGVTQVFAIHNFISVNKTAEADWHAISPQVEQILRRAFA